MPRYTGKQCTVTIDVYRKAGEMPGDRFCWEAIAADVEGAVGAQYYDRDDAVRGAKANALVALSSLLYRGMKYQGRMRRDVDFDSIVFVVRET